MNLHVNWKLGILKRGVYGKCRGNYLNCRWFNEILLGRSRSMVCDGILGNLEIFARVSWKFSREIEGLFPKSCENLLENLSKISQEFSRKISQEFLRKFLSRNSRILNAISEPPHRNPTNLSD